MNTVVTQTNPLIANAGVTQTINVSSPGGSLGGSSGSPPPTGIATAVYPSSINWGVIAFFGVVAYLVFRRFF